MRKVKFYFPAGKSEANGYFHKWIVKTFAESSGLEIWNYAIIELENGEIQTIEPKNIRFVDSFK